jgi:hypothetical protein
MESATGEELPGDTAKVWIRNFRSIINTRIALIHSCYAFASRRTRRSARGVVKGPRRATAVADGATEIVMVATGEGSFIFPRY